MTDQLDDLFADLRADTTTRVRPPGAVAARHTLRRRRTRRTVGAAAFLVVAGAGGIGAMLPARGETVEAAELADRAAAVVGAGPETSHFGGGVAMTGVVATSVMVAGHYTLTLTCVGRGRLGVSLRSGDKPITTVGTDCGSGAEPARDVRFTLVENLPVTTEVHATGGADGQAGYAYRAVLAESDRDRLHDTARERLAMSPAEDDWAGGFLSGPLDVREVQLEPGSYRILVACAGTGLLTFTLTGRTDGRFVSSSSTEAVCGPAPTTGTQTFEVPAGGSVEATLEPDDTARGQAAAAVRLERV